MEPPRLLLVEQEVRHGVLWKRSGSKPGFIGCIAHGRAQSARRWTNVGVG
jgi:hypothetical protein